MQAAEFLAVAKQHFHGDDLKRITDAVEFATMAHQGQQRKSGQPYETHVFATAAKLVELGMDVDTVVAGIVHDVPEDTTYTLADVEQLFGPTVAHLVGGVTKLGKLKYRGLERYVENLRRMFVAMAEDVRVMIIKFADRLHNLETLGALPPEKQLRIARESMEIFAPLAHRLGIGEIKGQLEDLAFPYVYPVEYAWVRGLVGPRYEALDRIVDEMKIAITRGLTEAKITTMSIHGRRKHLYSLYEKLIRPEYNRDIQRITDLVALRIVVQNVTDCYAVVGLVHQLWKPVPQRFKDYIAQPKPNGYRSLHTTVFGPHGQPVEIQVRDQQMHEEAEYGVAAHWHYNESGKPQTGARVTEKVAWARQLAEWKHELANDEQYLEALKIDALQKRIFCFTPTGDVIDLPEHATPIDFAYHVHSDLGTTCVGARVNDKLTALDTELRSGDVVEILTDKNRKLPNRDWLEMAKTQTARGHIRKALREAGIESPT